MGLITQRFLFLDDDDVRHSWWERNFCKFSHRACFHAKTMDQFTKALLEEERFNIIFLDHDLNDWNYRSYEEGGGMYGGRQLTGKDAAKDIIAMPEHKRPDHIHIHSWNDHGAMEMAHILREGGFPFMNITIKEFGYEHYLTEARRIEKQTGQPNYFLNRSRYGMLYE